MEWDLTISSGNKSVLSPRIYFMVAAAENGSDYFNNLDTIFASSAMTSVSVLPGALRQGGK